MPETLSVPSDEASPVLLLNAYDEDASADQELVFNLNNQEETEAQAALDGLYPDQCRVRVELLTDGERFESVNERVKLVLLGFRSWVVRMIQLPKREVLVRLAEEGSAPHVPTYVVFPPSLDQSSVRSWSAKLQERGIKVFQGTPADALVQGASRPVGDVPDGQYLLGAEFRGSGASWETGGKCVHQDEPRILRPGSVIEIHQVTNERRVLRSVVNFPGNNVNLSMPGDVKFPLQQNFQTGALLSARKAS